MLLVVSDVLRGTKSISDAARGLSLSMRHFDGPRAFSVQMTGPARRIVLLGLDDVSREMITRQIK